MKRILTFPILLWDTFELKVYGQCMNISRFVDQIIADEKKYDSKEVMET